MNLDARLTSQEKRIAEFIAWGAAKKEIADKLHLSVRTVENHTRNIFAKLEIQKSTELSVYWFCTHYKISVHDSPYLIKTIAFGFLFIISFSVFNFNYSPERYFRNTRASRTTSRTVRSSRTRNKDTVNYIEI